MPPHHHTPLTYLEFRPTRCRFTSRRQAQLHSFIQRTKPCVGNTRSCSEAKNMIDHRTASSRRVSSYLINIAPKLVRRETCLLVPSREKRKGDSRLFSKWHNSQDFADGHNLHLHKYPCSSMSEEFVHDLWVVSSSSFIIVPLFSPTYLSSYISTFRLVGLVSALFTVLSSTRSF